MLIFKNASWSAVSAAYRSGVAVLSVLIAVKLLGPERYGNISALLALFTLWLSLTSGVFMILVAKLMVPNSNIGPTVKSELFAAANLLAIGAAFALMVIAFFLTIFAPTIKGSVFLNTNFWDYARNHSILLGIISVFQIYSSLNSAIIESSGRLDLAMRSQMLGPSVILTGLAVWFFLYDELEVMKYILLLCAAAMADMLLLWVIRQIYTQERFLLQHLPRAMHQIPGLLKSGSAIQFSAFMNIFLEPLNKLILNHFAGGAGVASYDLAMKAIWGLQGLFGAVMRVFLHLTGQGSNVIAGTFVRMMTLVSIPIIAAHAAGALFLSLVLHFGIELERSEIMIFFGIAALSNLGMIFITPLYISLIGQDDRRFLFQNQLRLTVCNLIASFTLIPLFGLIGASLGLFCASFYNTIAIYRRFQSVIGPIEKVEDIVVTRPWTYFAAAVLLICSLIFGAWPILYINIFVVIIIALIIVVAKEPIVPEILKRIFVNKI